MLEHPKMVGQLLGARKTSTKANSIISYLKINRKGVWGILEKKIQGAKFYELENLDPCILLDFTKLV